MIKLHSHQLGPGIQNAVDWIDSIHQMKAFGKKILTKMPSQWESQRINKKFAPPEDSIKTKFSQNAPGRVSCLKNPVENLHQKSFRRSARRFSKVSYGNLDNRSVF